MNSHYPTPSSGRGRAAPSTAKRPGGIPYLSERQTQAYLLARDVVRRVQRSSWLARAVSHRVAGNFNGAQGDCQRSH